MGRLQLWFRIILFVIIFGKSPLIKILDVQQLSGPSLLLHDPGFLGSSHFLLKCAPYLVRTHLPSPHHCKSCEEELNHPEMGRNLELGLFQLSVHLIPYASEEEELQTESLWKEMRTGAGWHLVKRNILGAKKKAALLTELNASRSSFARAGPAPRDRVRATFDLDDATKSKLWEGR